MIRGDGEHTYRRARQAWGHHGGLELEKDWLVVFSDDDTSVTGVVSAGEEDLILEGRHGEEGCLLAEPLEGWMAFIYEKKIRCGTTGRSRHDQRRWGHG